jgi:hypothetical protein
MTPGLVTVIMPVYNGRRHLPDTLRGVAAQAGVTLQCLAVDDGSEDGSREFLRDQTGWQLLETNRLGPNPARDLALRSAEGEFVTFLDQDDLWHPGHLRQCLETLRAFPHSSAVVAPRRAFQDGQSVRLGGAHRGPKTLDPWAIHPVNVIDTPSMVVIRRPAVLEVGGWPSDRRLGSDPLLWWRLSREAPLAIAPRRTVGVRRSSDSLSATQRRWPLNYLKELRVAARDALAMAPPESRSRRDEFAEGLMDALIGIVQGLSEHQPLAGPGCQLERVLAARSPAMRVAAIGFLGWMLAPHLKSRGEPGEDDPARRLLEEWPREAGESWPGIRRVVAANTGPRRLAPLLRQGPGMGRKMRCFVESCLFRLAAFGGRIDDPLGFDFGTREDFGE